MSDPYELDLDKFFKGFGKVGFKGNLGFKGMEKLGDIDGDGVPNFKDCRPFDPNKHSILGTIGEKIQAYRAKKLEQDVEKARRLQQLRAIYENEKLTALARQQALIEAQTMIRRQSPPMMTYAQPVRYVMPAGQQRRRNAFEELEDMFAEGVF